jgi:hypothetical protein
MSHFRDNNTIGIGAFLRLAGMASILTASALAQYGGVGVPGNTPSNVGTNSGQAAAIKTFNGNYHVGFDSPEAWGLKYFASSSLLSGLPQPEPSEGYRAGSVSIGFELGTLPTLSAQQMRIGFHGTEPEDLNQAPIFARPVVRIGLPAKFSVVVAAPPPIDLFGVTPRLLAFGLERPLVEGERWTIGWRGYGQVGSVRGAFTCPTAVLAYGPGTVNNPTECVGRSSDVATLRYIGNEFQLSYRTPGRPRLVPHAAVGGNFIDGVFHVHAPVSSGLDETRLWTRGGTLSLSAGASYFLTKRMVVTVDAFYTPLWVQRNQGDPPTNDGLFNVRALVSYTFH